MRREETFTLLMHILLFLGYEDYRNRGLHLRAYGCGRLCCRGPIGLMDGLVREWLCRWTVLRAKRGGPVDLLHTLLCEEETVAVCVKLVYIKRVNAHLLGSCSSWCRAAGQHNTRRFLQSSELHQRLESPPFEVRRFTSRSPRNFTPRKTSPYVASRTQAAKCLNSQSLPILRPKQ